MPTNEILLKKWIAVCRISKKVTRSTKVCSNHFVENDYISNNTIIITCHILLNLHLSGAGTKLHKLKPGTVHSRNLPIRPHQIMPKDDQDTVCEPSCRDEVNEEESVEMAIHCTEQQTMVDSDRSVNLVAKMK